MDYELAKELEQAGYPIRPTAAQYTNGEAIESIAIPTLEELIEACGEGCTALLKTGLEWKAGAPTGMEHVDAYSVTGVGLSPSEAVARLWLALQTKPTIQ
jgi:hypothetical protein